MLIGYIQNSLQLSKMIKVTCLRLHFSLELILVTVCLHWNIHQWSRRSEYVFIIQITSQKFKICMCTSLISNSTYFIMFFVSFFPPICSFHLWQSGPSQINSWDKICTAFKETRRYNYSSRLIFVKFFHLHIKVVLHVFILYFWYHRTVLITVNFCLIHVLHYIDIQYESALCIHKRWPLYKKNIGRWNRKQRKIINKSVQWNSFPQLYIA
jgi:hypothetical protein